MNANETPNDGSYAATGGKNAPCKSRTYGGKSSNWKTASSRSTRGSNRKPASATRKMKILAGAILLADVEAGNTDRAQVVAMFKRGATRERDVKLLQEEGWL